MGLLDTVNTSNGAEPTTQFQTAQIIPCLLVTELFGNLQVVKMCLKTKYAFLSCTIHVYANLGDFYKIALHHVCDEKLIITDKICYVVVQPPASKHIIVFCLFTLFLLNFWYVILNIC